MNANVIEPRTLRGFRDHPPALARRRRRLAAIVERSFAAFGYEPIVTPALEYAEILKGKGGAESDKQMFSFSDQGGREVALRFDLTVPLARFVAQHQGSLLFPFRAYNMGEVWRGERPQRGRYREFLQCDADIIGATGPAADAEILTMIAHTLAQLEIGEFVLRVNDRRIAGGLLEEMGVADRTAEVLRALDKLEKTGEEGVRGDLAAAGLDAGDAGRLLALLAARQDGNDATLKAVADVAGDHPLTRAGIEGMVRVFELLDAAGVPAGRVRLDPSIARGLDYYTGMVYETTLLDAPEVGSVSSGGRYDDLAGLYTKTRLPGVGGSIGISRILGALEALGTQAAADEPPRTVVLHPGEELLGVAFALTARLRASGLLAVELYPELRKHSAQMRFADSRGAALAVQIDDPARIYVKNMRTGDGEALPADVEPARLLDLLGS